MAKVFKFEKNLLELEINGEHYEVDVFDPEFVAKYEPLQKETEALLETLPEREKEKGHETITELMELQVKIIETFIGEGEVKKVFGDRPIKFLDLVDLLAYLNNARSEFEAEKMETATAYSPNRSTRRKK